MMRTCDRICNKTCDKTCDKADFTKNQKPAKPVTTGIYGFKCMVEARRVELLTFNRCIAYMDSYVVLALHICKINRVNIM